MVYYQAICYHAIAMLKYAQRLEMWDASIAMGISLGKATNIKAPTLYESGVAGMQLKMLIDNHTNELPHITGLTTGFFA